MAARDFANLAFQILTEAQQQQQGQTAPGAETPINDLLLGIAQMAAQGTLDGTLGFTPQVAQRQAEANVGQARAGFDTQVDELAGRFAGTGSGTRGGAFQENLGNANAGLQQQIAGINTQMSTAAALEQLRQLAAGLGLGQQQLNFQSQFDRDRSGAALGGINAQAIDDAGQDPSVLGQIGGGLGSILGAIGGGGGFNELLASIFGGGGSGVFGGGGPLAGSGIGNMNFSGILGG